MRCAGAFEVELDLDRALALFTPEGERDWVEDWDPHYIYEPEGDRAEPGTVFLTHGHGPGEAATVWVIAAREPDAMRYLRRDPHGIAGSVEVRCTPAGNATRVEVTYALAAAGGGVHEELYRFAAGYEDYLDGWRTAIEAAIEDGRIAPDGSA